MAELTRNSLEDEKEEKEEEVINGVHSQPKAQPPPLLSPLRASQRSKPVKIPQKAEPKQSAVPIKSKAAQRDPPVALSTQQPSSTAVSNSGRLRRSEQTNEAAQVAMPKPRHSELQAPVDSLPVPLATLSCPPELEELERNPVSAYLGDNPLENHLKWSLVEVGAERSRSTPTSSSPAGVTLAIASGRLLQKIPDSWLEPVADVPIPPLARRPTPFPSFAWTVLCRHLKRTTALSASETVLALYRRSAVWQRSNPSVFIHTDRATMQAKMKGVDDEQILRDELSRICSGTSFVPAQSTQSQRLVVRQGLLDKMGRYWGKLYRRKFDRYWGGFTLDRCNSKTLIAQAICLDDLFQPLPPSVVKSDVLVLFGIDIEMSELTKQSDRLALLVELGYHPRLHHDYPNFTVTKIAAPPYSLTFAGLRDEPDHFKLKTITTYLEDNLGYGLKAGARPLAFFNPIELRCLGVELNDRAFWKGFVPKQGDWEKLAQHCDWKAYAAVIPTWLCERLTEVTSKMAADQLKEAAREEEERNKSSNNTRASAASTAPTPAKPRPQRNPLFSALGIQDSDESDEGQEGEETVGSGNDSAGSSESEDDSSNKTDEDEDEANSRQNFLFYLSDSD